MELLFEDDEVFVAELLGLIEEIEALLDVVLFEEGDALLLVARVIVLVEEAGVVNEATMLELTLEALVGCGIELLVVVALLKPVADASVALLVDVIVDVELSGVELVANELLVVLLVTVGCEESLVAVLELDKPVILGVELASVEEVVIVVDDMDELLEVELAPVEFKTAPQTALFGDPAPSKKLCM